MKTSVLITLPKEPKAVDYEDYITIRLMSLKTKKLRCFSRSWKKEFRIKLWEEVIK